MTTPITAAGRQKGVMDSAAARRAAGPVSGQAAGQSASLAASQQAQATHPTSVKVALLAPLSGKSASLGQAMVNAAQLAVFDMGASAFELMPRDTKGTPDGAVQAARDALGSGANLLIGPLFAADVAAVKPVVRESGVNMLALSTDVSLADTGAFVMGFAPAPQVERVISYAAEKGIKRFAAILPAGPYGQLVGKTFEQAVYHVGGSIVATTSPDNLENVTAHKDEIEAIFMPLGGEMLHKTTAALAQAGFEAGRVHLLGTGLWDEAGVAAHDAFLVGGWYAAPEPQARESFMKAYAETYNQSAPRLATLAYDATALAAMIARNGGTYDIRSLCSPSGFAGLDGIFRLKADGEIERGLAVLEVAQGAARIADPSPNDFRGR
ncbi:MAG: penicillin-binding protein activator [Alphaproteobacteria bacterium]|nr:penicillin-binding protein activator [Alphaproteobacteria bacterium]